MRLSRRQFDRIVEQALEGIPEEFRQYIEQVTVMIEDRPSPELLAEMGVEPDDLLFGVYTGPAVGEQSVFDVATDVPRILIFQEDLEDSFPDRAELILEIQKTVLHEIAHIFGIDEDRLDELGYG